MDDILLLNDQTRHWIAASLVAMVIILPFLINMWVKRKRPLTRHKYRSDQYGYDDQRLPLTWWERILARLRII